MMRAKDLKSYYVILIFFLVCFFGVTILFRLGVDKLVDDNALNQSNSYLIASISDVDKGIAKYEADFLLGHDNVSTVTVVNQSLFGDKTSKIEKESNMEGSTSEAYNVYFKNGDAYGKVSLFTVLAYALDGNENTIILVDANGNIVGANYEFKKVQTALEVLTFTNSSEVSNDINDAVKEHKEYQCKGKIQLADGSIKKGYFATGEYDNNFGIIRFVNNNLIVTTNDVNKLNIPYYVGIGIIIVGMITTLVFMIRKCKKTASSDPGISLRGANIVIVAKANGKIASYNKAFRICFPNHKVPITNLGELEIIESELSIDILIKEQRNFRMCYRGVENEEGEKDHEDVYFEFFSLKRSSDYSIVGKEITEDYLHEQLLIQTSTKSSITGDDNGVTLSRDYAAIKNKFKTVNDPYLLIMFNLRGFKDINSLLGFEQGNEVIIYFSRMLHEYFENLKIYHIQGDEFVVVDDKCEEAKDLQIIEKMLDSLKAPILINNNEIMLRPAVGVVGSDMDGATDTDYDAVMSKLIIATDKAKNTAGKQVCKYDINLENSAMKEREMEEDLKTAISKGEFVMFYQPQYEINQERVCGFEALLRWNNAKYASISPEVYIKLAEKNGFIIDVGNFINADVFKTAKEMEQYDIHISVNVSPAQIVQAGFVADFLEKFEKNGLKPGAIALEVTETFLMENFNTVIEKLQILKNRGISIHLDDFGTGYSSMLYLKELPIDTIKVDKEFIKHIETDRFSKVLTSKIITLAKELGDKVICEGVETKAQKDIVGKFGADIIQGYYIGKALSKEDAFTLLKTGKVSSENKTSGRSEG